MVLVVVVLCRDEGFYLYEYVLPIHSCLLILLPLSWWLGWPLTGLVQHKSPIKSFACPPPDEIVHLWHTGRRRLNGISYRPPRSSQYVGALLRDADLLLSYTSIKSHKQASYRNSYQCLSIANFIVTNQSYCFHSMVLLSTIILQFAHSVLWH